MQNAIRQTKALFLIKLRLLFNTIKSRAGLGKVIGMSLAAFLMVIATASAAADLLEAIYKLPFASLISEWAIGFIALYAIFVVFTGDIVSGHSLNTGQMSYDFQYLSSLPIPTTTIIFTKIFERLITDYFGILFLLPALIGISCYKACTLNALLTALLIYIEASLLIGLFINLVTISLTAFFKSSTINNFFSIFGYISAILTLIPVLLLSDFNPSYVPEILIKLEYIKDYLGWLLLPVKWISTPLILSTPFCAEFGRLSLLWLLLAFILTTVFYKAIKHNRFSYIHSKKASQSTIGKNRLLSGLFYKELTMLKSDFNLLVNAVIMPISIIIAEVCFVKRVFSFTSMDSIMNFIFGSIIYFSMFGPINTIGYEGKTVSFLETMPITPEQLIKNKFYFWYSLALLIFAPATAITFSILGFDMLVTLKAVLQSILFALAAVWVSISFSAIFAKYDTAVLQQRSTFVGKIGAMALLATLLPVKTLSWSNFFTLLVFGTMTYTVYIKAKTFILFRLDKEATRSKDGQMLNCLLLFLTFLSIERAIGNLFYAVTPDSDTGIWNWCLGLATMIAFVVINRKSIRDLLPPIKISEILKIILITALSISGFVFYIILNPENYQLMLSDAEQISSFARFIFLPKVLWKAFMLTMAVTFMTAFVRRTEEFFFAYKEASMKILGCLLVLLVSLPKLMPAILVYLVLLTVFNHPKASPAICLYSSLIFFGTVFYKLIY